MLSSHGCCSEDAVHASPSSMRRRWAVPGGDVENRSISISMQAPPAPFPPGSRFVCEATDGRCRAAWSRFCGTCWYTIYPDQGVYHLHISTAGPNMHEPAAVMGFAVFPIRVVGEGSTGCYPGEAEDRRSVSGTGLGSCLLLLHLGGIIPLWCCVCVSDPGQQNPRALSIPQQDGESPSCIPAPIRLPCKATMPQTQNQPRILQIYSLHWRVH